MRKTRILIECETYVQTAIETYNSFKLFEQYGHIEVIMKLTRKITKEDIKWCDILCSIRSENLLSTYFAQICNQYGRFHIVLLDDNLFIQQRTDYFMRKRQSELGKILDITNILIVSNDLLGKKIVSEYKVSKYVRIDTAVDKKDIHRFKKNTVNSSRKMVYYSNDGSNNYFNTVMLPILDKYTNKTNENCEVHCIGMDKIVIENDRVDIVYVPHMSLGEFRKYLANTGFVLGLAPLVCEDGFSEYKYFNKYIEFSMAGIPGLYSNTSPYNSIIRNGYNGFLCGNEAEWIQAINLLLSDQDIACEIAGNSQENLREEFSSKQVYNRLIQELPELNSYISNGKSIPPIVTYRLRYYVFCLCEKINSVYRVLINTGIRGLMNRTRQYFILKIQTKPSHWRQ